MHVLTVKNEVLSWTIRLGLSLFIISIARESLALNPDMATEQYLYRAWTTREGFPQNTAEALLQTRDGYMWFGTQVGLARYDGRGFKLFNAENTESLTSFSVSSLLEGTDGTLWVGTENGLVRYTGTQFEKISQGEGTLTGIVTAMAEDAEGRVWIGTSNRTLHFYYNGLLESIVVDETLETLWVHKLLFTQSGTLWVGTNLGLYRLEEGADRFKKYTETDGLPGSNVRALFEDPSGMLWVGTENGLAHFFDGRFEISPEYKSLSTIPISRLSQDRHGNIWVGTVRDGLFRIARGKITHVGDLLTTVRDIFAILEDREGSLWVGTGSSGAVQIREPKVATFAPNKYPKSNLTWSLLEDKDGRLWQGTDSGVVRYDKEGRTDFEGVPNVPDDPIFVLFQAKNGDLWLGTDGRGPVIYDGTSFEFVSQIIPEMEGLRIRTMEQDAQGRMLIGTRTRGLYVLDGLKVVAHFHEGNGLGSSRVFSLGQAPDGRVLVGTGRGLLSYRDGRIFDDWAHLKLPDNRISLPYFENGNMWLGTVDNGLYLYANNKVTNFNLEQGLPDNRIFGIEEHGGVFWIICNIGIFSVPKSELLEVASGKRERIEASLYGSAEGLYTEECNGGSQYPIVKTRAGHIWFACFDGAIALDPGRLVENNIVPPVIIESAKANDLSLEAEQELPYEVRRYDFYYSALSFVAPEELEVYHQLEGFDDDWVKADSNRLASYTNLQPGLYRFKVKAANIDGVWNEDGASLEFTILTPIYRQTTFWLLMGFVGLLLVIGVVYWRIQSERRRSRQLSELAWQRTRGVLEGQVDAIRELIGDSSKVAEDIKVLMDQLASSSEQVAAAVSETATTVQELERTGRVSEGHATRIVDAAKQTEDESIKGRDIVDRSVSVMVDVQKASQKIVEESKMLVGRVAEVDAITNLVGEISEQSAVLSINASIQASKAGEYGAGFGIVADNMQDLANRSKEATMQISDVLSSIGSAIEKISKIAVSGREQMNKGVDTIKQSGLVVRKLSDEMTENSNLAQTIAQSIEQQMTGLDYIARAVGEFTSTVDENKSISRDLAVGSNKLNRSIANLLETIEGWKTPEFYQK